MKKELIELFKRNNKLSFEDICRCLHIFKRKDKTMLAASLNNLISQGRIINIGEYYGNPKHFRLYEGTIVVKESGYGFFICNELENDVFIPEHQINDAYSGDEVLVGVYERAFRGKIVQEGAVCRIIKRQFVMVVGTFDGSRIVNDDKKNKLEVIVPKGKRNGAVKGHKVVGKIIEYNEGYVIASIEKILGHENDPKMDIISLIYQHNIPLEFPQEVLDEAKGQSEEIDLTNREDFRNLLTITIDGADAKDLDDAISLEWNQKGYTLYVHIADVSNYVIENSKLDEEAYQRGTSVYLADTVVPMLPHILSNGICSLNPKEERYTLTAIIDYNLKGEVLSSRIVQSVIVSNYRMTYENVNKMLNGEVLKEYEEINDLVVKMLDLAQILKNKRIKEGSIEFDSLETKIICDEDGGVVDVKPKERGISESIIEEFMLAANVCVAKTIKEKKFPFVYRVHENPDTMKLAQVLKIINSLGIKMRKEAEAVTQFDLQKILSYVDEDKKIAISNILLRSMMKARYSNEPLGHYGLAFKDYTHFTSPIRRYPDLIVHRLLRQYLFNHDYTKVKYYDKILGELTLKASNCEKRAVECERDVVKMKQAEYMSSHIDEVYTGYASGFTRFGMYVTLPNTVEGMVFLRSMDGDFEFLEDRMMIVDKKGKKSYHLGDKVVVKVLRASKRNMEIDFAVEGDENEDNCSE